MLVLSVWRLYHIYQSIWCYLKSHMFMPKNNYPYGSVRIVKLKLLRWQNGNLGNFMSSQSWFRGECFYFIVQCHANVTFNLWHHYETVFETFWNDWICDWYNMSLQGTLQATLKSHWSFNNITVLNQNKLDLQNFQHVMAKVSFSQPWGEYKGEWSLVQYQ